MLAPPVPTYRRGVRTPLKLAGIAACLAAGLLLATVVAGGVRAQDTTTTTTIEETTTETTSEPTTVLTTATVEHTTTRQIILPAATTTSSSSSSAGDTPAWVWVLLGVLAVALVILIVLLARRPGSGVAPAERRRRLDGAVASWTTQGWALESQSGDSAVLQRGGERMIVSVDPAGQVGTRPL
jgi:cytochrome bd-type quinol oxidase subunit 2